MYEKKSFVTRYCLSWSVPFETPFLIRCAESFPFVLAIIVHFINLNPFNQNSSSCAFDPSALVKLQCFVWRIQSLKEHEVVSILKLLWLWVAGIKGMRVIPLAWSRTCFVVCKTRSNDLVGSWSVMELKIPSTLWGPLSGFKMAHQITTGGGRRFLAS